MSAVAVINIVSIVLFIVVVAIGGRGDEKE